jgi:chromosome segregation ATPase
MNEVVIHRESSSLPELISYFRPLRILILCLVFLNFGCTHLHNQQNADLAKEISTEFKTFQGSLANPYSLMLQNQQKVDAKASKLQAEIAKQKAFSFSAQVDTVTWEQIKIELETERKQLDERNKNLKEGVEALLKEKGEQEAKVKDYEDGLKKARALLEKAIKEQQKWEARQVLFRSTIKFLADTAAAKGKKLEPQTLEEAKKDILDQKITVEDLNVNGDIKPKDTTVGDVLSSDKTALMQLAFGELLQKYTIGNFDPVSAPGLSVIILSLGTDLAKVQLDRANLEANYLKARIDSLEALKEESDKIEKALNIIRDRIKENTFVSTDQVLKTINNLRKQDKGNAILDAFRVLAYYSVTQTLDESARLELQTRPARLEHEYSIRLSAINAREHEALISRGLEGLLVYHDNGITPEMIANLLRAAQSVALAVLAAGVW